VSLQEERELAEAMRLSTAHAEMDEDSLLKRAMAESMKDKKPQAAPQRGQEDQDLAEAIRLSMLESKPKTKPKK